MAVLTLLSCCFNKSLYSWIWIMQSPIECNQTHIPALFVQLCSWKFLLSLTSPTVWIGYNLNLSPALNSWEPAGTQGTFIFCQTFIPLMQQCCGYLLPGPWSFESPQDSQGSSCGWKDLVSASTAVTSPLSLLIQLHNVANIKCDIAGKILCDSFFTQLFRVLVVNHC